MKLIIDARMYSSAFTGIGRYVYEITQEIFEQYPQWEIVMMLGEKEYEKFTPPTKNITKVMAPEGIYSLGEQTTFLKKLIQQNADLTWFPHFNVPILYPKKFVVTVHDLTISKFPGKKMNTLPYRIAYGGILKNALWRAEKIFTVSENTKNDLIHDEKISPEKIIVAGNAVGKEFTEYDEPDNSLEILDKKFGISKEFFLYTGQWREHKNVLGMVQAFHLFLKKHGPIAQLVITGNPNPLYPEILEYRKKHMLEDLIITSGLVDEEDLKHLYSAAKSYVFPSFYEGFGVPPLEAMAVGTPVIASTASCIPEVCGNAAQYFNPENIDEIADAMEKIFTDKNLQKDLVEKGYERIKNFSWAKSAKQIGDEMNKILQK